MKAGAGMSTQYPVLKHKVVDGNRTQCLRYTHLYFYWLVRNDQGVQHSDVERKLLENTQNEPAR